MKTIESIEWEIRFIERNILSKKMSSYIKDFYNKKVLQLKKELESFVDVDDFEEIELKFNKDKKYRGN